MSESLDSASRPSTERKLKKADRADTPETRAERVTLMAQRYNEGRDIWTGTALQGRDKREADRVNSGLED